MGTGVPAAASIVDPGGLVTCREREELLSYLHRALAALGAEGEVRVRLVGDREMGAAHERFSGIPGTTDVLTFDMRGDDDDLVGAGDDALAGGTPASGGALDVDIWACVDEARRHADAMGHALGRELLLYCLHGVLHCRGYDDHDPGEHARMHAEEDRILELIGVGRTFAPGAGGGAA
jgi:probable rRNA maturation factor